MYNMYDEGSIYILNDVGWWLAYTLYSSSIA